MIVGRANVKGYIIKTLIFLIQLTLALSFLYPIYYMLINSFKTRTEYMISPFSLPKVLRLSNYISMISQFKILNLFKNTFFIGAITVVFLLILGIIASYSFAKLQFKGRNIVYLVVITTLFIPAQVTIIPLYVLFAKVHLVNNPWSVILAYLGMFLPEVIMLMTSNFRGIPNELIEAADVEGCNYFQVIWHVIIPMGKPAITLTVIFYFIVIWNDLFTPMILLQSMDSRTVMVALATLMSRYSSDPTFQMAGLFLSSLPAILVYAVLQKNIVKGMTVGAIK